MMNFARCHVAGDPPVVQMAIADDNPMCRDTVLYLMFKDGVRDDFGRAQAIFPRSRSSTCRRSMETTGPPWNGRPRPCAATSRPSASCMLSDTRSRAPTSRRCAKQSKRFFALPEEQKLDAEDRQEFPRLPAVCRLDHRDLLGRDGEQAQPERIDLLHARGRRRRPRRRWQDEPLQGPNQWPDDSALPGFQADDRATMSTGMSTLARKMVGAIALSLGLPADSLDRYFEDPTTFLRLLHYPTQPPRKACSARRRTPTTASSRCLRRTTSVGSRSRTRRANGFPRRPSRIPS